MSVISSKIQLHIEQSLAFSGLAILEQRLMFYLRPDLWVAAHNVASDSNWGAVENYLAGLSPRVKVFEVRFEGRGDSWARVAARSDDRLADRIGWITGLEVLELREYQAEERTDGPAKRQDVQAQEEIPAWPCAARTEALERRGERDKHAKTAQTRSS